MTVLYKNVLPITFSIFVLCVFLSEGCLMGFNECQRVVGIDGNYPFSVTTKYW